ncbi:MAG: type II toxin-antitoxin system VapC family toxin [Syntrophobacteria bacterium]
MAREPVVLYWDASAILSALFVDSHSSTARKWADREGVHLISTLAYAEVTAVMSRLQREQVLADRLIEAALEVLARGPWRRLYFWPQWGMIGKLAFAWSLRGADLWHLATAKSLQTEFQELRMLSFDRRLNAAASSENLAFL